jgi:hypothetical protein
MNEQLPVQLSFDVSLPERAQRIRDLVGVARTCIIEIGRELIAAKAEVAHGDWLPWLKEEFGWSIRTADNYIAVARKFASVANLENLTIDATALYALSAPDVPQEARDEAVERAEDGEHISIADAEAMIADAMRVEREKFEALVAEMQADVATEHDVSPAIPVLVEQLCKATGRKKLKPAQLQQLACILGTAITDGTKVYPPSTLEETRHAEAELRISAPALRALEYFLAAPEPVVVLEALPSFQVDAVRRCAGAALVWIRDLEAHLGRQ